MKNKIQYILSALALSLVLAFNAQAQSVSQKIGNNPNIISPNAVLEMESANKGVLFPRVALTSITDVVTVPSPTNGLTVFNTATAGTSPNNVSFGYYYWSAASSRWVKLAVETPPIAFAKTVYFNGSIPSTATIFDEINPPVTNDNALKAKDDNIYVANDGSTWTYDIINGQYKTYAIAPSTPFYLSPSTTTDAGYNKTSPIWRSGNIGIGISNPATNLHIHNTLYATQSANADAKILRFSRPATSGSKWDNIAQFDLGSYSTAINANTRLDLTLNDTDASTFVKAMTWQANGNVGIGTSAPAKLLHIFSPGTATAFLETSDKDAGQTSIDFRTGTTQSWRLIGQGTINASRFDIHNQTRNTPALSVMPDNKIGIGTMAPSAQLEVVTTDVAAVFKRANTSLGATNVYLQRTETNDIKLNKAGIHSSDVIGKLIFSMANGTNYPGNGNALIGSYYVAPQTTTNAGGGLTFRTVKSGTTLSEERVRVEHNGNVGIGNYGDTYDSANLPGSKLEVDGASTNKKAYNANNGTVIDFALSNLAYTTSNPTSFTLQNIKDGGTYTLAVQGTSSALANFTATGFTFKSPNNGLTVAGKETIYTFIVMGTTVYFYMTAGI